MDTFRVVQCNVESGMDINAPIGPEGLTPLLTTCGLDHVECAEYLLQNGADPNLSDISAVGTTPLMVASVKGYEKCISLLLRYGADPNIGGTQGHTPLSIASQYGHDKCVSLLFEHGVEDDMIRALCDACQNGHYECVSLLLQHSADPLITFENNAMLHVISPRGHDKCLSLLLQNPNVLLLVDKAVNTGETPLFLACITGHVKCVIILVEHGANVNSQFSVRKS